MLVLMGAALAMMTTAGRAPAANPGPHGFSEVLYAVLTPLLTTTAAPLPD
ncbi:potassium-transporting ATPase subunit KdpA [Shigella flexneri]